MGLFSKLKEGLTKTRNNIVSGIDSVFSGFSKIDDDFYDELEETLIMGDIGVRATEEIIEDLKEKVKENKISISEISTEEASKLLESIKGVILNSLVDVPRALKIYQGDKFEEYLNYANAKEEEGRVFDIMPPKSFIHPVSIQTYLKYAKYNANIDFAKYHNDLYEFEELNNIEIPLFMRWGNTNEMIEQPAEKLVKMMNEKIKNPNKDINYIDGADHGYYNRENELAEQIAEFLEKYC